MLTISISGIPEVKRAFEENAKQARFASAKTLTTTGKSVAADLRSAQAAALPSSSAYTARGQFSTAATKLSQVTVVGIKDAKPARGSSPAMLLKEHFFGGARGHKPMEKAIVAARAMPDGWQVVPGKGMPLDAFGNPKRTAVAEVLGALRSGLVVFGGRGKRSNEKGFFVAPVSPTTWTRHLHPGIYRRLRVGNASLITPVFLFVKPNSYRRVIDLQAIAAARVARDFAPMFGRNFAAAMASAR